MGTGLTIPSYRVGVFGQENALLGTAATAGFIPTPVIIAESNGADTILSNQKITRTAFGTSDEDQLAYDTVEQIISVSDTNNGVPNYTRNVDYALDDSATPNDAIQWLGTAIPAPGGFSGIQQTVTPTSPRTGLPVGTHYYKITSIRQIEFLPTPTNGETTPSNEMTVIVSGGNNAALLNWTPVTNAQAYGIYRTDTPGAEKLIATVIGGASTSFLDDGYADGVVDPPVSNTAWNRPADGADYYITYEAIIQNYFNPKLYFDLGELLADHGLASQAAVMGTLILGGTGLGQGASQCMVVSIPTQDEANYLTVLTNISGQNVQLVVPSTDNNNVQMDVMEAMILSSSTLGGKPRNALFGAAMDTPLGDPLTVDSVIWKATRLVINDSDAVPQGRRAQFISNTKINVNVTQPGGSLVATDLDGWYLAAAVAGVICALPDVATSATFVQIQGIQSIQTYSDNQRDFIQQNGLLTCFEDIDGIIKIYQDQTLDTLIVENQERCIVSARDEIFRQLLLFFKSYVGRKITPKFLASVASGTKDVLSNLQSLTIIESFDKNSVVAVQDINNRRRVVVSFAWGPLFPCNQLVFQDGFNV